VGGRLSACGWGPLKKILQDEVDRELEQYLGRGQYERRSDGDRQDYGNGFRMRKKFISMILEAYRRRMRTVDQLILACFVLGMSTRKASTALVSLLGERVSATTVSEVAKALDGEVRRYHERKLSDGYRFLFINGLVLKQKGGAKENAHRSQV